MAGELQLGGTAHRRGQRVRPGQSQDHPPAAEGRQGVLPPPGDAEGHPGAGPRGPEPQQTDGGQPGPGQTLLHPDSALPAEEPDLRETP